MAAADRPALYAEIRALIERLMDGARDDAARDHALFALARYQIQHVPPYARFCAQRLRGRTPSSLDEIPALPADAFRYARISSRDEADDVRRFVSSGTTQRDRSLHAYSDLSLYDLAARVAARHALFPDLPAPQAPRPAGRSPAQRAAAQIELVVLAPSERELPESSLSYMLARFVEWFGSERSGYCWPLAETPLAQTPLTGAPLDALCSRLARAEAEGTPLALLGTSFAFVHALDALRGRRFALPRGSRIMHTGGFKGRAREIAADVLYRELAALFGVDPAAIVAEYGMTELSSQLYDLTLRRPRTTAPGTRRRLWAPGWLRVTVVDPESLAPLPNGREGLVRIDDLANLDSVACVQTADLGVLHDDGLELLGRASAAVARGCSITADALLAR